MPVLYERLHFNNRKQQPGESITTYMMELSTIARNCAYDTITPDEILWEATEQTQQQIKLMTGAQKVKAVQKSRAATREGPQRGLKTKRHQDQPTGVKRLLWLWEIIRKTWVSSIRKRCNNCGKRNGELQLGSWVFRCIAHLLGAHWQSESMGTCSLQMVSPQRNAPRAFILG